MEQKEAYKSATVFGKQSKKKISYLKSVVSKHILRAVDYANKEYEEKLLKVILEYLDTRLHPIPNRQLAIWRTKQNAGIKHCKQLHLLVLKFYETGMDHNSVEEWLILLCLSCMTDEKILAEIFKNIEDIETTKDLISLMEVLKARTENSARTLDMWGG